MNFKKNTPQNLKYIYYRDKDCTLSHKKEKQQIKYLEKSLTVLFVDQIN